MPDLIIYDCDGTLIDSERLVARVCLSQIHALGLTSWTMDDYVRSFVGMPGRVGWGKVSDALGRELPSGFNAKIDALIDEIFASQLKALPDVRETVAAIGGPACVASTTAQPHLSTNLGIAGLADLFGNHVFSASQVRRPKPAPDVFLFAASQMGYDPGNCVVIEDSVPGVTAARRAGMAVIGFTGAAHDPAAMRERLSAAGAISVIHGFVELPQLIGTLRNQ